MPYATAKTTTAILAISFASALACAYVGAAIAQETPAVATPAPAAPAEWPRASTYSAEITRCLETPVQDRGSIRDFVCPAGNAAGNTMDTAYQVVLDLAFREIDREAESWIKTLKDSGGRRISRTSANINDQFGAGGGGFRSRYLAFCDGGAFREAMAHFGKLTTEGNLKNFVASSDDNACKALVRQKMDAFRTVAWIVAGRAATEAYKAGRHKLVKETKGAYDRLADKFMLAIGQMNTILHKMPSKTPKVVGQ